MRLAVAGMLLALPTLALPAVALADPGSARRDGKMLSVSQATGLRVDGQRVTVRGSGYDTNKGIYVAFCVDNGPGQVPTPCGGGADTEGSSGNSVWISDFPPAYGAGLAQRYDEGGSFTVQITVRAQLNEETDCRKVRCAVVTRNDHTRSDDRSQDVLVPVSFGSAATPVPPRTVRPAPTRSPLAQPVSSATPSAAATPRANAVASAAASAPTATASAAPSAGTALSGSEPQTVVAAPPTGQEASSPVWRVALIGGLLTAAGGFTWWRWRRA